MANPTIVVLTDRNIIWITNFTTSFPIAQNCCGSQSRASSGKHPLLSDRHNIVVIADEAHRSQYDFIDGFAKHI